MKKVEALEEVGAGDLDVHGQRSALIVEIVIGFPVSIAIWLGVYDSLPPISGMEETLPRRVLALKSSTAASAFNCCQITKPVV